jgi:cytochrome b6-f complex iron-sulfur subunit
MTESTDRRRLVKTFALGGASLILSRAVPTAAQPSATSPVKITDLETLDKEFAAQEFKFADKKCLLVRLPAPKDAPKKSDRILEASLKAKDGKAQTVYLTAYTRVCTHLGCTPALPDPDHRMACPCHGSIFAVDGSVIQGPAARPLQAVKLTVKDGAVLASALLEDK